MWSRAEREGRRHKDEAAQPGGSTATLLRLAVQHSGRFSCALLFFFHDSLQKGISLLGEGEAGWEVTLPVGAMTEPERLLGQPDSKAISFVGSPCWRRRGQKAKEALFLRRWRGGYLKTLSGGPPQGDGNAIHSEIWLSIRERG